MVKLRGGWRSSTRKPEADRISERILEFARPMFEGLGAEPTAEIAQPVLLIAITIWNTAVIERWGTADEILESSYRALAKTPPDLAPVVERLFQRKADLWPNDLRAVGDWEIRTSDDGDWVLRIEARTRPRS
jgi:hypothetical protein